MKRPLVLILNEMADAFNEQAVALAQALERNKKLELEVLSLREQLKESESIVPELREGLIDLATNIMALVIAFGIEDDKPE